MIKQNIKIAIIALLMLIGLWAIISAFIKMDVTTNSIIDFTDGNSVIYIENKQADYIQSHGIEQVKIKYKNEKFNAKIFYQDQNNEYTTYTLLSDIPTKETGYITTTVIITTLNFYKYLFKK